MEQKPRVRVAKAEMDFPHEGEILTAVHPFCGPANTVDLLRQIRGSLEEPTGYREPTNSELVSFIHEYFSGSELQARDANAILHKNYLRAFTGVLFVPEHKVAYFKENPELNERGFIDPVAFMKSLGSNCYDVPFESFGNSASTDVDWRKIRKHPYFLGWAGGEESAEKFAELVSRRQGQHATIIAPRLEDLKEPTAKITAMYAGGGNGLKTYCTLNGDIELAFSFGIIDKKI